MVTIIIGDKKYNFEDKLIARDYIDTIEDEMQKAMTIQQLKMFCNKSINPKITFEDVMKMEYAEFMMFFAELAKAFKIGQQIQNLEQK